MEKTVLQSKTLRIALNPSNVIETFPWLVFLLGMMLKCAHFQFSSKLNVKPYFSAFNSNMILATFTSLMLLVSIILLLFNRKRMLALFITDIVLTLILVADTLYFRYYYNAITVPVLYQIGLVGSLGDSIKSLFKPGDMIFLVSIPLYIAGFSLLRRMPSRGPATIQPIKRIISAIIVVCVSFGLFQYAYGKSSYGIFEYDNNYVINNLGICYFHYYDVKRNIEERFFTDHSLNTEEKNEVDSFYAGKTATGSNLRGIAKGSNLIVIQMEAIQQFLINMKFNGEEITPNLNKFINDSTYLDNFYYQVGTGNTADAEFLTNNSLYPLKDGAVYFKYPTNTYESTPKLLKEQGYNTYVFHANNPSFWNRTEMYKAVGFDRFFSDSDYAQDDRIGWGLSDKSFYRQSLEKIDLSRPFYGFFISLTSHHPFNFFTGINNFDVGNYQGTVVGNYVRAAHYADAAIGEMLEDLRERGLYDKSVIVIYGDHHAVLKDQADKVKDLVGFEFSEYNWTKIHKTPCFIRYPEMTQTGVNHTICGEIDVLPTVANLLGVKAPHAMGKDILNTPSDKGYAVLRDGSVITDGFMYVGSEDKVYGNDGQVMEKGRFEQEIKKHQKELEISDIILQKNALASYSK